mmetsp:Transcript_29504/g.83216  ORF Transcript_29504/g.83216 Transcript_29504/m.83216 type:complete len:177 (+) Transcript_29504:383-913(+)|eukprot:CAMPEP_0117658568 /NCGR_PEP_ID=MMETSP0804-20121206/5930_1 /TAXON_ID=1074897 /ORGANISM="Tetraselmis astigmatica, Strain CCMP880" /LENGTH=176 /DNA_ID=CAMNT_0005465091 /DNA_START=287 /DNA_END=817 /DNA_ORIENTATION=+
MEAAALDLALEPSRPTLTADAVMVAQTGPSRTSGKVLLVRRAGPPFEGCWALPGGLVSEGEPLKDAASRHLAAETSFRTCGSPLHQLGTFGDPGRDPRGWTVSVAYGAVVLDTHMEVAAGGGASEARWFPLFDLPQLALDHAAILQQCLDRLVDIHRFLPKAFLDHLLSASVRLKP